MIRARGLVQTFRSRQGRATSEVRAVDGVDLDVEDGEVVGFLGPNGAGKTTTLRILTTLLRPTAGTATVAGHDVATQAEQVRRSIGYVSQAGGAFSGARAGDEVVDHGMLYGLPRRVVEERGRALFTQLDLEGLWTRTPRTMSGGQKRRLDIVMGIVHEPRLVFLDEPTTGLDPQARANLWEHIRGLRDRRGATVLLTTHYLDEADALSDRIVIIDHGRVVASDTPAALKEQVAGDLVDLEVEDPAQRAEAAARLERLVAQAGAGPGMGAGAGPGAPSSGGGVEQDGRHVRARVRRAGRAVPGLLRELDAAGVALASIEVVRPTLDDVFLALTGRSLRDTGGSSPDAATQGSATGSSSTPGSTTVPQPAPTPSAPTASTSTPTTGALR